MKINLKSLLLSLAIVGSFGLLLSCNNSNQMREDNLRDSLYQDSLTRDSMLRESEMLNDPMLNDTTMDSVLMDDSVSMNNRGLTTP